MEKQQGKIVSFQHLARFHRAGSLTLRERIAALFGRQQPSLDEYMAKSGGMLHTAYPYQGGVSGNATNTGMINTPGAFGIAEIELDFAAIAAARIAAGQAALAATDVLQLFGLPAGIMVERAVLQVTVAEGAACTMSVGDGTDDNGYIDAADANAVGWSTSLVTTAFSVAVGGGKLYTAADTVDLLLNSNGTNAAAVRIALSLSDFRNSR